MSRSSSRFLLGLLLAAQVAFTSHADAQSQDSLAVVEASKALLQAISARDTAAARRLLLPGAIFVSVMDPASPSRQVRVQADTEFYRTLPRGSERLLERLWSPRVMLLGSVAEVHAPYDFHVEGKFSHCGTDVLTFVRSGGAWRISAVTYTVQVANCAPSPLGPPSP